MNHIKTTTVTLNGKAYPIAFSINEMIKFLLTLDIDITDREVVEERILNNSGNDSMKLALIALKAGANAKNEKCNLNKKDIERSVITDPEGYKILLNRIDELALNASKGELN